MRKIKFRLFGKNSKEFLRPENQGLDLKELQNVCDIDVWHVMQYTGLKDVNGVDIYEGDIVQVSGSDGYYVTAKVVYECGAFWFYAKNISLVFEEDCDSMVMLASMYIEDGDGGDSLDMVGVVGNIYETPELLGGTTNGKG